MKVVAIIQARMGSTRLPGKVMMPLAGRPMIEHVVERARRIDGVDEVVVATSRDPGEEPLVEYVEEMLDTPVVRGPEGDVLKRFQLAATRHDADVVIRITGDCPLLSPRISAEVLQAFLAENGEYDYASNTLDRTYPRGLDTEVFSFEALQRAHERATSEAEREHVTVYMASRPRDFRLLNVSAFQPYPAYRWTVDTPEDLELVRCVFSTLLPENPEFEFEDVLDVLARNPNWIGINAHVPQKRVSP